MSSSLYDQQGFRLNQHGERMLGNDYGRDVGERALNNQEHFPENQPMSPPVIGEVVSTDNPVEAVSGANTGNTPAEMSAAGNHLDGEKAAEAIDGEEALPILSLKQLLKERLGSDELVEKYGYLFKEVAAGNNVVESADSAAVEKATIAKLATVIYREMLAAVGLVSVLDVNNNDWERTQFQELSFLDNFSAGGSGDPQEISDQFLRSVVAISRLKGQSLNEASQEDWQKLSQTWQQRNQELHGTLFQVLREHLLLLTHLRELYLSQETLSTVDELVNNSSISAQELMNIQASAPSIAGTAGGNTQAPKQPTDAQQLAALREQISQFALEQKQSEGEVLVAAPAPNEITDTTAIGDENVSASVPSEPVAQQVSSAENPALSVNDQSATTIDKPIDEGMPANIHDNHNVGTPEQSINPAIIEPPPSGEYSGGVPLASNVMQSSVVLPKLG